MTALAAVPHKVGVRMARWARLPSLRVLGLAVALGVVASTQYLFQPFVWRHWPVDEVLLGWFTVLLDRLAVALAMGLAVAVALAAMQRVPDAQPVVRGTIFVVLVLAGAVAGELLLVALEDRGRSATAGEILMRSLRWAVAALAVAGLRLAWLRSLWTQSTVRAHEVARLQADGQITGLRLQALQAQIEPHFLFNTLATVRRLGATRPGAVRASAVPSVRLHPPVACGRGRPRALVGRVRDRPGARLPWVWSRCECAACCVCASSSIRSRSTCEVPPLMLATLVENAVKHGITPSTNGGEIVVSARRIDSQLELAVADSGVGFAPGGGGGSGIGLSNTRARLRSLYGTRGRLDLSARTPQGVVASLHMPAREVSL